MVGEFQGAIIAAGRGERLRKAAGLEGSPKPLVELGGETLLVRQARAMLSAGAREVIAVINSETAALMERRAVALPAATRPVVRDTANSMESMLALEEHIVTDYFLAATVDSIMEFSQMRSFASRAAGLADANSAGGLEGALGVVRWRGDERALFAEIDGDGVITALGDGEARFASAGVYFLPRRVFDFAPRARAEGLQAMRRLLAMLIREGMRLGAVELTNVIDIDEAADLEAARKAFGPGRPNEADNRPLGGTKWSRAKESAAR